MRVSVVMVYFDILRAAIQPLSLSLSLSLRATNAVSGSLLYRQVIIGKILRASAVGISDAQNALRVIVQCRVTEQIKHRIFVPQHNRSHAFLTSSLCLMSNESRRADRIFCNANAKRGSR
jgi:hypothetical protein